MFHSWQRDQGIVMRISLFILAFSFMVGATLMARTAWAEEGAPATACLTPQEMRETVPNKHLTDASHLIKHVSGEHHAELVNAKLCRQGELYIYEFTLLPRDGKVVRVSVDAVTGQILSGKPPK